MAFGGWHFSRFYFAGFDASLTEVFRQRTEDHL